MSLVGMIDTSREKDLELLSNQSWIYNSHVPLYIHQMLAAELVGSLVGGQVYSGLRRNKVFRALV